MQAVLKVRSGWGIRKTARHFGVSPGTITKWCSRAPQDSRFGIPTMSSRPHHSPRSIPDFIVDAIVRKRLGPHPRCGVVIQKELENEGMKVSVSTVNRILDRYDLLKKRSKWQRPWKNTPRPLPEHPGDLVQIDTIYFHPYWYCQVPLF